MTLRVNKIFFLLLLVIVSFSYITYSQTNDTITIQHKYYTTTFSKSKHFPVAVKYWLTRSMLECEHRFKRINKFMQDPFIPEFTNLDKDYKRSGYDRGHQMGAFDWGCDSIALVESFYYSNIAPQSPGLNRGIWKRLEKYARKLAKKYDSVIVYCGSITQGNKYIGRVAVPDKYWKIYFIKKLKTVKAYSFRNEWTYEKRLSQYEVPIDSIQNMIGSVFVAKLYGFLLLQSEGKCRNEEPKMTTPLRIVISNIK